MSHYDSLLASSTGSLSDYDMVDEIPTDNDDLSEFDSNSVLSTSDYEGDTPDDSSSISDDHLEAGYQDDSDNESFLGGDNQDTFTIDSDATPSSSYIDRGTSIVSLSSDRGNELSESILNNTLSFSASLAGSNSTLKIPTAAMSYSQENHNRGFHVETDAQIHGDCDASILVPTMMAKEILHPCSVANHFHSNVSASEELFKSWDLKEGDTVMMPYLNILGFTDDVNNMLSISMFRRLAQLLQAYVGFQIKIFVCDKPVKSSNSGLAGFNWYQVNPGLGPTLTKLALDDDSSKRDYEWLCEKSLAVLDWRNTDELMMDAAEAIGRSPMTLYHSLRDTVTLSFVSEDFDLRETMFFSKFAPQKVVHVGDIDYHAPLTWDEFQADKCYLRQLICGLARSDIYMDHHKHMFSPYKSVISGDVKGNPCLISRAGPTMMRFLNVHPPVPIEISEPHSPFSLDMKPSTLLVVFIMLVGFAVQMFFPQMTLDVSIISSYNSDGSEVSTNFSSSRNIISVPDINLHLTRITSDGFMKIYSPPVSFQPAQISGNSYLFYIPNSERWGVMNGSVRIGDAQSEDVLQKVMFLYGGQNDFETNISDTLVMSSEFSVQPTDAYTKYLRRAQKKSVDLYARIKEVPEALKNPNVPKIELPAFGTSLDLPKEQGLGEMLKSSLSYFQNLVQQVAAVSVSYWDIFLDEVYRLAQEASIPLESFAKDASVSLESFTSRAKRFGQAALESKNYEAASEMGKSAFRKLAESVSKAQDSAVHHYSVLVQPKAKKFWSFGARTGEGFYSRLSDKCKGRDGRHGRKGFQGWKKF